MTSYHEHNERSKTPRLVAELLGGKDVALVSDAGTPLLSDPGYRLVRLCRETGISVIPIPGASAAVAALSVSGLLTNRFVFAGFLPRRPTACREELRRLALLDLTLVLYLSPHNLRSALRRIVEILGNRKAFLIREMTKVFEEAQYGALQEILEALEDRSPRGEYTLVIEAASAVPPAPVADLPGYVRELMRERSLSQKEAIKAAAQELGLTRREVYRQVTTAASRRRGR